MEAAQSFNEMSDKEVYFTAIKILFLLLSFAYNWIVNHILLGFRKKIQNG